MIELLETIDSFVDDLDFLINTNKASDSDCKLMELLCYSMSSIKCKIHKYKVPMTLENKNNENNFLAIEVNDNTNSPKFEVGDVCLIDYDCDIKDNDFVVAFVDNKLLIRKFHISGYGFKLTCLDTSIKSLFFLKDELNIIGKIVLVTKKV